MKILIGLLLLGWGQYAQAKNFKVYHAGEEVTNGQIITIDNYSETPGGEINLVLHLNIETTKELIITLSKNDENALTNTLNDMCWSTCTGEPSIQESVKPGTMSEFHMTYNPKEETGTSRIVYTIKSSSKADTPLVINADFVYNGKGTSIQKETSPKFTFSVFQVAGTKCFSIKTSSENTCQITVNDLSGRVIEETFVSANQAFVTRSLSNGCYLISLQDINGMITTRKAAIQ
ncbi:T9SS type A sorting domain-containing protein [Bacteroides sp.]